MVALVVVAIFALSPGDDRPVAPVSSAERSGAETLDRADPTLVAIESAPPERRLVDIDPAVEVPARVKADPRAAELLRPGTLVVRAVDAVSGEPVSVLRIRAISATRFALGSSGESDAECRSRLTPGDYVVCVASNGYEPAERGPVRIESGTTSVLEPVRLHPGSGRIVGHVAGPLDDDLFVDLHGQGRRRCAHCSADPCERCGWSADRTRIALARSGELAFERLAAGVYVVRLVDRHGREAGTPLRVSLAADETRVVTPRVARARDVVLALDDVDGARLDRLWSQRLARERPYRMAESTVPPLTWSASFRSGEVLVAHGELAPPDPDGVVRGGFGSVATICTTGVRPKRDDRARDGEDTLRPPVVVSEIELAQLDSAVDDDGRIRFEGVPARATVVELRCEPFQVSVPIARGQPSVRRVRIARDASTDAVGATYVEFEAARSAAPPSTEEY